MLVLQEALGLSNMQRQQIVHLRKELKKDLLTLQNDLRVALADVKVCP